ncbi:hypothetical protein KAS42_02720 [bacterium]|nr:hypothetical protein [bacterium]
MRLVNLWLILFLLCLSTTVAIASDNTKREDHVVVPVTEKQMAVIKALPEKLVCVTSVKNPIKTLAGLEDNEFWVFGFSPSVPVKLMAAFGRKDTAAGISYVGLGNESASFDKTPHLRLYITDERRAEILERRGGISITFEIASEKDQATQRASTAHMQALSPDERVAIQWISRNNKLGTAEAGIVLGFKWELEETIKQDRSAYWLMAHGLSKSGKPYILTWIDGCFVALGVRPDHAKERGFRDMALVHGFIETPKRQDPGGQHPDSFVTLSDVTFHAVEDRISSTDKLKGKLTCEVHRKLKRDPVLLLTYWIADSKREMYFYPKALPDNRGEMYFEFSPFLSDNDPQWSSVFGTIEVSLKLLDTSFDLQHPLSNDLKMCVRLK